MRYNSTIPLHITNSYYTLSYAWFSMQCVKWNTYYYTILWLKKKHTKSQNWEILGVSTCSSVGTWWRKIQYIPLPVYSSTSHFTLWFYIDDSKRSEDQQYDGSCSHGSLLKFDKQIIHNWNTVRERPELLLLFMVLHQPKLLWQTGQKEGTKLPPFYHAMQALSLGT